MAHANEEETLQEKLYRYQDRFQRAESRLADLKAKVMGERHPIGWPMKRVLKRIEQLQDAKHLEEQLVKARGCLKEVVCHFCYREYEEDPTQPPLCLSIGHVESFKALGKEFENEDLVTRKGTS